MGGYYSESALREQYLKGYRSLGTYKGVPVYLEEKMYYDPFNGKDCYYVLFDDLNAFVKGAYNYGFLSYLTGKIELYDEPRLLVKKEEKKELKVQEEEKIEETSPLEKLEKELADLMRKVTDDLDMTINFEKN